MIPVDSLLYKIDQKLNKLSTNEHQQIQLEDKILALNDAQLTLINRKFDGLSVPGGLGFDSFKKRYADLQILVEDYIKHPLELTLKDENINQWGADLNELDPKYMFFAGGYVLANKGRCKDHIIWVNPNLAKHSDIQLLLKNKNYCPSFEYQETFAEVSSNEISIFTDGTFTPSKLYIMYIRYPVRIDKAGYENFDGTSSVDQNCELEDYLENELVDIAVQAIGMYTENMAAVQSAQIRIQTNE